MKKRIKRIGLGFLLVVLVTVIVTIASFAIWKRQFIRELESQSTLVQTPLGQIEYAEIGQGRPILVVHGTPGGYDQPLSSIKATQSEKKGYRFIMPSRPGYLRTRLSVGATPQEQAQAFAALLTELHIDKVVVHAVSGGGPSALQFAMQYPERCSALILEVARTQSSEQPSDPPQASTVDDMIIWLFGEQIFIKPLQDKHPDDSVIATIERGKMYSRLPSAKRVMGKANDISQFATIENWPLNQIRCPTLILHGTADTNVPIANAEYAHDQIANSEFVKFTGEDHLVTVTKHKEIEEAIAAFLARHPGT